MVIAVLSCASSVLFNALSLTVVFVVESRSGNITCGFERQVKGVALKANSLCYQATVGPKDKQWRWYYLLTY